MPTSAPARADIPATLFVAQPDEPAPSKTGRSISAKLRKAVFWIHLVTGIAAGTVILSMALTGSMLAFRRQITDWAERGYRASPVAGAVRLSPKTLLVKAQASRPGVVPTGLSMRADPAAPATIMAGRESVFLVNPYTGEVLGEGAVGVRGFFRWVEEWHRWFGLADAKREVGKAVTGACSLCFLGLTLSGCYLWWPRRWTWRSLKPVALPSVKLRGKARDFNWHNAVGFWCAPVLLVITLTGVIMSYPWANDLLYRLTGSELPPPKKEGGAGGKNGRRGSSSKAVSWGGLGPLLERAEQKLPGWKILTVRFVPGPRKETTFVIDQGDGGRPDLRSELTLTAGQEEAVRWEPFSSYNAGRRLRLWARFLHTGEAGGWLGQTLAAFGAIGAVILVWTGFALAWRRFVQRPAPDETPSHLKETQFSDEK